MCVFLGVMLEKQLFKVVYLLLPKVLLLSVLHSNYVKLNFDVRNTTTSQQWLWGPIQKPLFFLSAPEFLRSAVITSMKGQGKCSQTFRVYTVTRPNRRKMFLFVFVSFVL